MSFYFVLFFASVHQITNNLVIRIFLATSTRNKFRFESAIILNDFGGLYHQKIASKKTNIFDSHVYTLLARRQDSKL